LNPGRLIGVDCTVRPHEPDDSVNAVALLGRLANSSRIIACRFVRVGILQVLGLRFYIRAFNLFNYAARQGIVLSGRPSAVFLTRLCALLCANVADSSEPARFSVVYMEKILVLIGPVLAASCALETPYSFLVQTRKPCPTSFRGCPSTYGATVS